MTDLTNFVDWEELKGKEARGVSNDVDLGEVQELGQHYIMTQKGRVSKVKFFIPKYLAEKYDGHILHFNLTEGQKMGFVRESPPTYEEYERYKVDGMPVDIETRLRMTEA